MRRAHHRLQGLPALELIEQAIHLVRCNPGALAIYLLGTVPCVLAFLFFCAEMSRSAFARERLAPAALALAGTFVWMKGWQAVYGQLVRAQISGHAGPGWPLRRLLRIFLVQAAVQPAGLFLLTLAAMLTIPFGWVYAFFQNMTALGEPDDGKAGTLAREAWRQALLWPSQNHSVLLVLFCFGLFVFLNWLSVGLLLPYVAKTLFGIESVMTRAGIESLLNTTFFSVIGCLTYLVVDPILKTVYALRCFYGQALGSGEDIQAGLRAFEGQSGRLAAIVALALLLAPALGHGADAEDSLLPEAPPGVALKAAPEPSVPATDLDQAIEQVLQQRKFAWRLPRDEQLDEAGGNGLLTRFMEGIRDVLKGIAMGVAKVIEKVLRAIFGNWRSGGGPGIPWYATFQAITFVVLAFIVAGLLFLLWRAFRGRKLPLLVAAEAIQTVPDLTDDNVGADQLPEEGWIRLARELLAKGELRFALRAFYLASLAYLAERNLVQLARFKSNRDYENELRRRSHALPGLVEVFAENVSVFDRVWYGRGEVDEAVITRFSGNVQQIKGVAVTPPGLAGGAA